MSKDTGGSAFPSKKVIDAPFNGHNNSKETTWLPGMTLRDYFAAKAMQALIIAHPEESGGINQWPVCAEKTAYTIANAMIAERNKA